MDRIDLHIEVPAVKFTELSSDEPSESSEEIRNRISIARKHQLARFDKEPHLFANAHMDTRDIRRYCPISDKSKRLLKMAIQRLGLSARAYDRILKVSRTIADLEGESEITTPHVAEAIQYRSLDRQTV